MPLEIGCRGVIDKRNCLVLETICNLFNIKAHQKLRGALGRIALHPPPVYSNDLHSLNIDYRTITRPYFTQNGSLLSQRNNLLEETMVTAEQRSPTLSGNITIHSELRSPRLARESIHSELRSPRLARDVTIHSEHLNNSLHYVKTVPEEDEEAAAEEVWIQLKTGMHQKINNIS